MKIEKTVHFQQRQNTRREATSRSSEGRSRVPRISRLMALATRLEQLIREGLVTDQAELARLGHVTRARLTQIMNLLFLSPDLQEEILFLQLIECGRSPLTEKQLRPIAATSNWSKQRQMWQLHSSKTSGMNKSLPGSFSPASAKAAPELTNRCSGHLQHLSRQERNDRQDAF
jgi:hypothetical protein